MKTDKLAAVLVVVLFMIMGLAMLMYWAGRDHAKSEIMRRYDQWVDTSGDTDVRTKCYIFESDSTHTNCYYH